jgi:S1-C subfamily serine protease
MTSGLPKVFWLGLFLAAFVPAHARAALSPEELYQKVLPSVMTLEVESQSGEKFVGSGVLARADDVALTAWHVVADARSVWAVFADGSRVRVIGCLDYDRARDLALLKLEKPLAHRQASLGRTCPPVAAHAYVVGAPKGYGFSISDGLVSQIREVDGCPQYQLSCPISPGNSGSPVFNSRAEVIGIASWTKADAQNVSFAIPSLAYLAVNISRPPKTWEQLAVITGSLPPSSGPGLPPVDRRTCEGKKARDAFAAFQQQLNNCAGKSVTVVVLEATQTNTFTFIAP